MVEVPVNYLMLTFILNPLSKLTLGSLWALQRNALLGFQEFSNAPRHSWDSLSPALPGCASLGQGPGPAQPGQPGAVGAACPGPGEAEGARGGIGRGRLLGILTRLRNSLEIQGSPGQARSGRLLRFNRLRLRASLRSSPAKNSFSPPEGG